MEEIDDEDFEDAYWLIPGVTPEPYWDINLGKEMDILQLKSQFQKALSTQMKVDEQENLARLLRKDSELLLHIGLTPYNLSDLINHNHILATQIMISLASHIHFSDYLESLLEMQPCSN